MKDSVSQPKPKSLSANDFDKYFKSINNPEDPVFQADDDVLYFNERFLNSEIQLMCDAFTKWYGYFWGISKAITHLKNGRSVG